MNTNICKSSNLKKNKEKNIIIWFKAIIDIYIDIIKISKNQARYYQLEQLNFIYSNPNYQQGICDFNKKLELYFISNPDNDYEFKTPLGYFNFLGHSSYRNNIVINLRQLVYKKYKCINNKFTVDSNGVSFKTYPSVKQINNYCEREEMWTKIEPIILEYIDSKYSKITYLNIDFVKKK